MKKIKWGVFAFLVGEVVTIFRTDKKFKNDFSKKEGFEKISFLFEKLFSFNKELVTDTKKSIKKVDLEKHVDHVKSFAQVEYELLKSHLATAKSDWEAMSDETVQPLIDDLKERFEAYKKATTSYAKELDKKYHLKEKVTELKNELDELIKKYKKK